MSFIGSKESENLHVNDLESQFQTVVGMIDLLRESNSSNVLSSLKWALAKSGKPSELKRTIWTHFEEDIAERLNAKGYRGFDIFSPVDSSSRIVDRLSYNRLEVLNLKIYKPLRDKKVREEAIVSIINPNGNLTIYHEDIVRNTQGILNRTLSGKTIVPCETWREVNGQEVVVKVITKLYQDHPATK